MLHLISLISFLLPTQLGLHLNNLSSTVYGFKIDYLTPTIYFTDLLIFTFVIWFLFKNKFRIIRKNLKFLILFFIFIIINIYLSDYKIASVYKWVRISELLLFAMALKNLKNFKVYENFLRPLSYSIILVSAVGILEWIKGGSLGGPFYLLGERSFKLGLPGISSFSFFR